MIGQEFKDPLLQVYCEGMKMKCAWKREQWYSDKLLQQPSLFEIICTCERSYHDKCMTICKQMKIHCNMNEISR